MKISKQARRDAKELFRSSVNNGVLDEGRIRKVVTAHCVAGFFFNLGVLALTINVLATS